MIKRMNTDDSTAPYNELEAFDSLWQALRWTQIRKRVPICFKKTLYNRYMLANLIYLVYAACLLAIDFHPTFAVESLNDTDDESTSPLDQPILMNEAANRFYIALAALNIFVAFLYWWAWRERSWLDIILIPEYLNHIQAGLYLWSAIWYPKQETIGGHYTMAVHRIEVAASCVELCAAVGWMISWYMTYTRTLGRGFTFDDPDTIAYLATTTNTLIYFVYNIQMNVYPEQYGTNQLFAYADILGFIGACYYIFGCLRDENWFWFLPLAGQYGVAAGRVHIEDKVLPQFGKTEILITDACRKRRRKRKRTGTTIATATENLPQTVYTVDLDVITSSF